MPGGVREAVLPEAVAEIIHQHAGSRYMSCIDDRIIRPVSDVADLHALSHSVRPTPYICDQLSLDFTTQFM